MAGLPRTPMYRLGRNREGYTVKRKLTILVFWGLILAQLHGQTTGKIAGVIVDKETGKPIVGANVYLKGTTIGCASDSQGEFYIINVPPGKYTLVIQMIGYAEYVVEDLQVFTNRTAFIRAELTESALMGEVVTVTAEKISIKKDQTSSIKNISSSEIEALPVENINDIVNMQAGVVRGHFRGGRLGEVAYMIDGVPVVDVFSKESQAIEVEKEAVQDLEIITGTFNAEYGRAMSGVVNIVTKDGGDKLEGNIAAFFGNYITSHTDIFIGLKNEDIDRWKDFKLQLSGPLLKKKLHFMITFRDNQNMGYLNGIHRFNPWDYSNFYLDENEDFPIPVDGNYYSEHTGTNKYVPMNYSKTRTYSSKLTAQFTRHIKLFFMYTGNDEEWADYYHSYKYNPYGIGKNHRHANMYTLKINHFINNSLFYNASVTAIDNYYGWYVYEDPEDPRYVHDAYSNSNGPGFYTGGQQKDHTRRTVKDYNFKWDLTWQMNKRHQIKTGVLYTHHDINHEWHQIRNKYEIFKENENEYYYDALNNKIVFPYYEPYVLPDSSKYSDIYHVKPIEISAYIQDKMEFGDMVVNAGVRFDYFDPKTTYPSQWRNPGNQLDFPNNPEKMSQYLKAPSQYQISPRLGLSYILGKKAVLHFSYGHFFQMPPYYALYQNHSKRVGTRDYETTMGNPLLKAERTVKYEVGLWQELVENLGLEVNLYYSDIYNLLSTKIISTFNQIEYGLYTNKDYGNAKGLEVKIDYSYKNFYANVNYTLQYTKGNADNPLQTFDRAGNSMDPIPKLIPMSWDQRHTFNFSVGYNTDKAGITITGYYNSGTPYTWTPISEYRVANVNLYPNNAYQSSTYSVDVNGYVRLIGFRFGSLLLDYAVYNLFDRLNENWVDSTTGRAYTSIVRESDLAGHRSDFNDYYDVIRDPSMYQAPRFIKVGLEFKF